MINNITTVKSNYYCTVYYCSLIYEPCLDKHTHFFISTVILWNCSTSLEIFLFYQTVYQYLLDNLVSRLSFVPTVIAALHPSNNNEWEYWETIVENITTSTISPENFLNHLLTYFWSLLAMSTPLCWSFYILW